MLDNIYATGREVGFRAPGSKDVRPEVVEIRLSLGGRYPGVGRPRLSAMEAGVSISIANRGGVRRL